ncbi:hypothetical protein BN1200_1100076 [Klebsiella variicola]|nr:hypothetical protein BN1200_1100076 [Klebsiella variicola]
MLFCLTDEITDTVKTSRFPDSHSERPAMCLSLDPSVTGKYLRRYISREVYTLLRNKNRQINSTQIMT